MLVGVLYASLTWNKSMTSLFIVWSLRSHHHWFRHLEWVLFKNVPWGRRGGVGWGVCMLGVGVTGKEETEEFLCLSYFI